MTDLTLLDAIDSAMFRVRERIAAALVAGDDMEAGRIIREAVNARLADWRELELPLEPLGAELDGSFRDALAESMPSAPDHMHPVFAPIPAGLRSDGVAPLPRAEADEMREKCRDDAHEQWAEMTAEMRAHEAGE